MFAYNENTTEEFGLTDLIFEIEENEELQESSIFKSFIENVVNDNEEIEPMQNDSVTESNDGTF